MTAALEGGEWSAAHPGRTLPPGKTRYPFYRRLGGPQGQSGLEENLVPIRIRSRIVQPVVSRYTDRATGVTVILCSYIYIRRHINILIKEKNKLMGSLDSNVGAFLRRCTAQLIILLPEEQMFPISKQKRITNKYCMSSTISCKTRGFQSKYKRREYNRIVMLCLCFITCSHLLK